MGFSVVKVALIAGVAGAVILSTGATAIAATREDPGVMAVSATSDDDGPDGDVALKKGSKEAKGKKKVKLTSDLASRSDSYSYSMYSSDSSPGARPRANAEAAPRGVLELTRDLLADGRS